MTPRVRRGGRAVERRDGGPSSRDRLRGRVAGARGRLAGSWIDDIITRLKALHFVDWITIFGAELLWSALPLVILLSSLADERIDDDISRHIGLDSQGAQIVRSLFRNSPAHAFVPIVTGLIFALAGVIAVVGSLQTLYERVFEQKHRGWRNLPRSAAWMGVLLGVLVAEGNIDGPLRNGAGPVIQTLLGYVVASIFFGWTMRFLLAGRVRWRLVVRPALVTGLLWVGLAGFSGLYFSSVIIEDSRLYGTIGVVFTLLTWFMLIGAVIAIGAVIGAVWQQRRDRRAHRSGPSCNTVSGF